MKKRSFFPMAGILSTTLLALILSMGFHSGISHAATPQAYPDLASLQGVPFFRLTCSDSSRPVQTHILAEINEGQVRELKIALIAPAESVKVIDLDPVALASLSANLGFTELLVKGDWFGAVGRESLSLAIRDGSRGLVGHFDYDDGEGFETSIDVRCGATNYVRVSGRE